MSDTIVIVGGGVAAASFCTALRASGCPAQVIIVSREAAAPYERPALTKSYLTGAKTLDQITLLSPHRLAELAIQIRPGVSAVEIDVEAKELRLSDGSALTYGTLVLCPGLTPKRVLPEELGSSARIVRTHQHADLLKADLSRASRIAVLGGGWLGLECAACFSAMGKEVTVIETAAVLCARNATAELAELLARRHRARGTRLLLSSTVVAALSVEQGVRIDLAEGDQINVDLVVEAIGATSTPIFNAGRIGWSAAGVPVDRQLRTNAPDVYAIGDLAIVVPEETGIATRFETWANAVAQSQFLARHLAGSDDRFNPDTWFWSDQGSDNFQIVGFPQIADHIEQVIDEPECAFWRYLKGGELVGAVAFNEFRHIKLAKRELQRAMATS
jgi:3-phenylpropionate/trans-cinnamate dioxygenase ferredoxin reductase subunit